MTDTMTSNYVTTMSRDRHMPSTYVTTSPNDWHISSMYVTLTWHSFRNRWNWCSRNRYFALFDEFWRKTMIQSILFSICKLLK